MLIKKKKLSRKQSSPKSEWNEEQQHVDTVVFVHGILGNETGTWGEFPHLLHTDRDLPKLDILCWGYRSDVVPRRYQDIETEGEALISDLETLVEEGNDLYLVGHSMGGLVILKGLVNRIRNEHGSTHPVNAVRWITLYSSPLLGSAVANVVSFTISAIPVLRQLMKWLPGNQLYDLRRGDFVEQLVGDTESLIYQPTENALLMNGRIPVRACYAKQDNVVAKKSAIGIFIDDPPPKLPEGTHSTIKLPEHHRDTRYLVLKNDLEQGLCRSFGRICRTALCDNDINLRRRAAERFDRQYGQMLSRCAYACFGGRELTEDDLAVVALRVWEFGEHGDTSPAGTMRNVVIDFTYRDDKRLDL